MRRPPMPALITVASLVAAGVSCDPPGVAPAPSPRPTSTGASGGERRGSTADGGARRVEAPLPEDDLARAGHTVFDAACGQCHNGDSPSGGALANLGLDDRRMNAVYHAGSEIGGLMPAVSPSAITERDLPAVSAYLRTIHALR